MKESDVSSGKKKQFLNLYAGLGYKPTKNIIVPGYKPVPPEGGSPTPAPPDIEEIVRNTTVTILDKDGHPVEIAVADLLSQLSTDMEHTKENYLIGYVEDSDSDQEPDNETIYMRPEKALRF